MKNICIILAISLLGICNLHAQQVCSTEDIPDEIRPKYRAQVEQFLNIYYNGLLFNIGDDVIKETYIDKHMMAGTQRYKPEFLLETYQHQQYLQPSQYLQELDKIYTSLQVDNLALEVTDISINKDFYKKGMASCYLIADYDLTLKNGDKQIFKRRCRAYCLFPSAMAYITVKLMQVEPVKDISISQEYLPEEKIMTDNTPAKKTVVKHYDYINPESEGLSMVRLGKLHGYIDKDGNEIIPLVYEDGYPFWAGIAAVRYGGCWGYINTLNQIVVPIEYNGYENARKEIKRIANKGNPNAQLLMGYWHYFGREGYKQSLKTALDWFALAGNNGMKEGAYLSGYMFEYGQGVDVNYDLATKWYAKAKGYADADEKYEELKSKMQGVYYIPHKVESRNKGTLDNIISMEDETLKAVFYVLSDETKKKLSLSNGIEVLSVFDGKLKEAGVMKGFIITKANGTEVTGLGMFEQIINESKNSSEKVLFLNGVYPTGKRAYFAVDLRI